MQFYYLINMRRITIAASGNTMKLLTRLTRSYFNEIRYTPEIYHFTLSAYISFLVISSCIHRYI